MYLKTKYILIVQSQSEINPPASGPQLSVSPAPPLPHSPINLNQLNLPINNYIFLSPKLIPIFLDFRISE
jgi:hypothetical protein